MQTTQKISKIRKLVSYLAILLLGATATLITLFALGLLFVPSPSESADQPATVVVEEGSVEAKLTLNARPAWTTVAAKPNGAEGTVTSIDILDGDPVNAGQQLYSVNLRPVIAGVGSIPSFGDLGKSDEGEAVVQLQNFLSSLGYWPWNIDGKFSADLEESVKLWQLDYGYEPTGVIHRGDILWFDSLPERVSFDSELFYIGAEVAPGQSSISVMSYEPKFSIEMKQFQAQDLEVGTPVTLFPDGTSEWYATIDSLNASPENPEIVTAVLSDTDASICGDDCGTISFHAPALIRSEVELVPEQHGLVIPNAAIQSNPQGETILVDPNGVEHAITIIASSQGVSLVEGVSKGFVATLPNGVDE